jgi:hypothetical protein
LGPRIRDDAALTICHRDSPPVHAGGFFFSRCGTARRLLDLVAFVPTFFGLSDATASYGQLVAEAGHLKLISR